MQGKKLKEWNRFEVVQIVFQIANMYTIFPLTISNVERTPKQCV
jgi:hypothetical protein